MALPGGAVGRGDRLRVVHDIPGRLRVRVPAWVDPEGLIQAVQAVTGVASCTWSPTTRGLLVAYGPATSAGALLEVIRRATGASGPVEALSSRASIGADGVTFGGMVSGAVGEIDRLVRQLTRETIGLAGLVPTALALWAVREVMLGRAAPLAWSTALWYAHGLFRDYNTPQS